MVEYPCFSDPHGMFTKVDYNLHFKKSISIFLYENYTEYVLWAPSNFIRNLKRSPVHSQVFGNLTAHLNFNWVKEIMKYLELNDL